MLHPYDFHKQQQKRNGGNSTDSTNFFVGFYTVNAEQETKQTVDFVVIVFKKWETIQDCSQQRTDI